MVGFANPLGAAAMRVAALLSLLQHGLGRLTLAGIGPSPSVTGSSCTPTQFSPGSQPVWDGTLSGLLTYLGAEVLWVFSVVGDFVLNIFEDIFGGIGCAIQTIFAPVAFFQTAWTDATSWLSFAGPFAPVVAVLVFGISAVIAAWFIDLILREFVLGTEKTAEDAEEEGA